MKTTKVTNILTRKEHLFVNDQDLTSNIVNVIICTNNQTSQLLNKDFRTKYSKLVKTGVSKNGQKIAFCYDYDLIARLYEN